MAKKLSSSLSQFIANNNQMDTPFTEPDNTSELKLDIDNIEEFVTMSNKDKKKKKKNDVDSIISRTSESISEFGNIDDMVDTFDSYLDDYFLDDEDAELRRDLLRHGRKYARDTKVSEGQSEISKAYSESEKLLSGLLDEIEADKAAIQNDINNMRMMRTRNYKTLSELINSRSQFHNTALSVIKELNAMKKNQFDLQMKIDKTKKEEAQDDSASNKAIQNLFSLGRDSLLTNSDSGGYANVSGSNEAGTYDAGEDYGYNEDEYIQKTYFSNDEESSSDGDKFLQYEGLGVHYILLYDDNGNKEIIAEDKDGNIIPDYPLPSDPDNLDFDISTSTGTATDNLANNYELRKM